MISTVRGVSLEIYRSRLENSELRMERKEDREFQKERTQELSLGTSLKQKLFSISRLLTCSMSLGGD